MAVPPLSFSRESEVDEFVARFQARTLPKVEWTHHAHLVVGLWHVLNHGPEKALELLRQGIRSYNESTGTANSDDDGYHESWTYFFVQALDCYARTRAASDDRLSLFNSLSGSRLADEFLALVFYSRGHMMSTAARRTRVEPDVQPLSSLRQLLDPAAMAATPFYLRRAERGDAAALVRLVVALAEFEKLEPPGSDAQARLIEDAFGSHPRFEAWLGFADGNPEPVGYAIFLETYSSFLARPTLYIEDVFVLPGFRKRGIGGALLRKALELAHNRGCGRAEWSALDWNVNAQRLYEQELGARRMSEWFLYRMTEEDITRHLRQPG